MAITKYNLSYILFHCVSKVWKRSDLVHTVLANEIWPRLDQICIQSDQPEYSVVLPQVSGLCFITHTWVSFYQLWSHGESTSLSLWKDVFWGDVEIVNKQLQAQITCDVALFFTHDCLLIDGISCFCQWLYNPTQQRVRKHKLRVK